MLSYLIVPISTYLYITINKYLFFLTNDHKINIRLISSIHSSLVTMYSFLFYYEILEFYYYENLMKITSYGYFLLDTSYILYFYRESNQLLQLQFLVHHFIAFIMLGRLSTYSKNIAMAFCSEITTPLTNLSWYLKYKSKNNIVNRIVYPINALTLLYLFFIYRICNFYDLYFNNSYESVIYSQSALIMFFFNIVWFIGLILIYYNELKLVKF